MEIISKLNSYTAPDDKWFLKEETDTLVTFQERPDRIVRITQGDLTLEIVE
jgi:hypothetical protein